MNKLDVYNFSASINCRFTDVAGYYVNCNEFSYSFHSGAYALTGDIGDGGWAFAYALCPMNKEESNVDETRLLLHWNGTQIMLHDVEKMSWYIGYYEREKRKIYSVKEEIEEALSKNSLGYTAKEIKEMFFLTEARFDRPLDAVGIEVWKASMAIGFSQNKKIFCFPYMGINMVYSHSEQFKCLFKMLKSLDIIVLMPILSTHLLPDVFDKDVNVRQLFFNGLSPDEREQLDNNPPYIKPF